MATHPIGKGTRNLSVNIPQSWRDELDRLARASGMRLSEYVRILLEDAITRRLRFRFEAIEDEPGHNLKVAEEP